MSATQRCLLLVQTLGHSNLEALKLHARTRFTPPPLSVKLQSYTNLLNSSDLQIFSTAPSSTAPNTHSPNQTTLQQSFDQKAKP